MDCQVLSICIYLSLYEKFAIKSTETSRDIFIVADENLTLNMSELLPPNIASAAAILLFYAKQMT
ncbi:MAG: hypothetical protein MZU97_07625 [Bacillus subtilis]|nr:hypothetical protein [Bacillus subtilis]